jgi:effector-binding domain-containing protein
MSDMRVASRKTSSDAGGECITAARKSEGHSKEPRPVGSADKDDMRATEDVTTERGGVPEPHRSLVAAFSERGFDAQFHRGPRGDAVMVGVPIANPDGMAEHSRAFDLLPLPDGRWAADDVWGDVAPGPLEEVVERVTHLLLDDAAYAAEMRRRREHWLKPPGERSSAPLAGTSVETPHAVPPPPLPPGEGRGEGERDQSSTAEIAATVDPSDARGVVGGVEATPEATPATQAVPVPADGPAPPNAAPPLVAPLSRDSAAPPEAPPPPEAFEPPDARDARHASAPPEPPAPVDAPAAAPPLAPAELTSLPCRPHIADAVEQIAAVVALRVSPARFADLMGPAIGELLSALAAQGQQPAGSLYVYHRRSATGLFDVEVGFPVASPIQPAGRVRSGALPAGRVARAVCVGPYHGLAAAWDELDAWILAQGLTPIDGWWEHYLVGPETTPDSSAWRTELNRRLT